MNPSIIDPYMISIGGGGIRWYSFFAFIGYLLAFILMIILAKRRYRLKTNVLEKSAFFLFPISLLGARIWYILFNYQIINEWWEVIAFWDGGIAIQGGVVFGALAGVPIFWKLCDNKKDVLKYCDCIFPLILVGQAIGRWGNFFNMEILGHETDYQSVSNFGALAKYFHYPFESGDVYRVPLFAIQFLTNIFAAVLIVWIAPFFIDVKKYAGILLGLFFIASGTIRASMELQRAEYDIMRDILGTPASFALSICYIIFGILFITILLYCYKKDINNSTKRKTIISILKKDLSWVKSKLLFN